MKTFFKAFSDHLKTKIFHKYSLVFSFVFFAISVVSSLFYYGDLYSGNSLSWIGWILSILTFAYSFLPGRLSLKKIIGEIDKRDALIGLFVVVLYFASHLWNFSSAPWNQNGLFDDAAWDIYFAKSHVFSGSPLQPAFFDSVGFISREVVFHFYISLFFKIFGYNLLVFNISLLFLGFVTVLFTTLLVQRIFKDIRVTLIAAFVINFFPFHLLHIFMGHRYAIAAPLMLVSLYFAHGAFANKSLIKAVVSSFFAALCWGSAIMGKQYILGLALTLVASAVFAKGLGKSKQILATTLTWICGFIISSSPLLVYIAFNYEDYVLREQGLLREFLTLYQRGGFLAIKPYIDQLLEIFFAKHTFRRQFLSDFYLIPLPYYLLIIPGLLLATFKKRFEIVFLSLIPIAAALFSGSYDFRVLLAVPIWVIAMAFALKFAFDLAAKQPGAVLLVVLSLAVLFFGLTQSISYLWQVSRNPNYLYLLPHRDVSVSRLVQDIVAGRTISTKGDKGVSTLGVRSPSSEMKEDEFKPKTNLADFSHDSLVCPYSSYAIMHLYLQDFDDKKVLSFCNQGIQLLQDEKEILENNLTAIAGYEPSRKDLLLIWETSEKVEGVINLFRGYEKYGSGETVYGKSDGRAFSLYILTIKGQNIKSFQRDVSALASREGQ